MGILVRKKGIPDVALHHNPSPLGIAAHTPTRPSARAYADALRAALVHMSRGRILHAHVARALGIWTRVNGIFVLSLRANTAAARGLPLSLGGSTPEISPLPYRRGIAERFREKSLHM